MPVFEEMGLDDAKQAQVTPALKPYRIASVAFGMVGLFIAPFAIKKEKPPILPLYAVPMCVTAILWYYAVIAFMVVAALVLLYFLFTTF